MICSTDLGYYDKRGFIIDFLIAKNIQRIGLVHVDFVYVYIPRLLSLSLLLSLHYPLSLSISLCKPDLFHYLYRYKINLDFKNFLLALNTTLYQ